MSLKHPSIFGVSCCLISIGFLLVTATVTVGQVRPSEISSPQARAAEEKYLPELTSLGQSIAAAKFDYPFKLARYLHAKPGQQAALDRNGIEFVDYGGRVILKVSGISKVAFEVGQRSANERAERALNATILPILKLVEEQLPQGEDYDGIGFEILYEKRRSDSSYDYQGKEVLTVIFRQEDASEYVKINGNADRQKLLNRADIFVNGEEFGLALHQRDPISPATLERFVSRKERAPHISDPASISLVQPASFSMTSSGGKRKAISDASSGPGFADAVGLQRAFQSQLDALAASGGKSLHMDDNFPPTFEVSGDRMQLHLSLRNEKAFDRNGSSIYKRAAQSFDLFLVPELRDLSRRLIVDDEFDAIDFSVANQFGVSLPGTETIDYICPVPALREFVGSKITTQELINQSAVLVNGERISLEQFLISYIREIETGVR